MTYANFSHNKYALWLLDSTTKSFPMAHLLHHHIQVTAFIESNLGFSVIPKDTSIIWI